MISAEAGTAFIARVVGFPEGLAAPVVGVQIIDELTASPVVLRGTVTVTEEPAGSGSYIAIFHAPPIAAAYTVFWDWDSGGPFTPSHTAAEDLIVTPASAAPPVTTFSFPAAAIDVDVPHFALPFRLVDGKPAVVEQDSYEEIYDCAQAIARCPQGFRLEAPTFGVPDQAFADETRNATVVAAAIEQSEPRTRLLADGALEQLVSNVTLSLTTSEEANG
jgi:hypothetical protein